MPPSMKCSPSIADRRQDAGHRARRKHDVGQRIRCRTSARRPARSTRPRTGTGTDSSSTRPTGSSAVRRSRISVQRLQVRAAPRERREPPEHRPRPSAPASSPSRHSSVRRSTPDEGRIGGEERSVDRPDRRTEHEVRLDAALGQGAEHPDLVRAEDAASAEDERDLARARWSAPCSRRAPPGAPERRRQAIGSVVAGVVDGGPDRT